MKARLKAKGKINRQAEAPVSTWFQLCLGEEEVREIYAEHILDYLAGQADGPGKRKETGWVSISACKSYQNNYEFCSPDGLCGRLTWALSETLEQGIDFQDLVESIEALYDEMPLPPGPPQNPDAEAPAGWNGKIF